MQRLTISSQVNKVSPFDLNDEWSYRAWRDAKLHDYPQDTRHLIVEVKNINRLSVSEHKALVTLCKKTNAAIYRSGVPLSTKDSLRDVCASFGLNQLDKNLYADDDGISVLQVSAEKRQFEYIPYSDKLIKWHTDGYYNQPQYKIHAMVLHCVHPAQTGGGNTLLDHEIVYLLMRDENPDYIEALMQPDAMTIPANIEQGVEIRPAQTGPVFSVDEALGDLHMRYTARTRSIEWKDSKMVKQAVQYLEHLLASDLPYIHRYKLQANEGILSNNILHGREKFENSDLPGVQRLMYRARYHDRISGTSINDR
ncbi:MAG: TauD/TfdA family dioxygenase [Gammaproteobacteria bacterium]|nr:TauD/TfdA family dioxygenase [Gammaproteobacteria bacterium]